MSMLLSLSLTVFVRATEDVNKFLAVFRELFGKEVSVERAEGVLGNPIIIIRAEARKKKAEKVWEDVKRRTEGIERIREDVEERLDGEGVLHLRFDKDTFVDGRFVPAEGGRTVKMEIKVTAFPARREKLIEAVRELLA